MTISDLLYLAIVYVHSISAGLRMDSLSLTQLGETNLKRQK